MGNVYADCADGTASDLAIHLGDHACELCSLPPFTFFPFSNTNTCHLQDLLLIADGLSVGINFSL